MVWSTTAFPKPKGIYPSRVSGYTRRTQLGPKSLTMLSQSWGAGEFSFINDIKIAATNGKRPNTRLSLLYFPVRCIIQLHKSNVSTAREMSAPLRSTYPAKSDPHDTEIPLGIRCAPEQKHTSIPACHHTVVRQQT